MSVLAVLTSLLPGSELQRLVSFNWHGIMQGRLLNGRQHRQLL